MSWDQLRALWPTFYTASSLTITEVYSLCHLVFSIHFCPCYICCGWLPESLAWGPEDILHHLSPTERYFSAPFWGLEESKLHHWLFHITLGCSHQCPVSPNSPSVSVRLGCLLQGQQFPRLCPGRPGNASSLLGPRVSINIPIIDLQLWIHPKAPTSNSWPHGCSFLLSMNLCILVVGNCSSGIIPHSSLLSGSWYATRWVLPSCQPFGA